MKFFVGIGIGILVLIGAIYMYFKDSAVEPVVEEVPLAIEEPEPEPLPWGVPFTYGTSVEGRALTGYTFGDGAQKLVFVGGIHGGYEWNSVTLANLLKDHLIANPETLPDDVQIILIPVANPDGLVKVAGEADTFTQADVALDTTPGRFNANNIDLNRNFDCNWKPEAIWRSNPVDAGTAPFSEPESSALRDFMLETQPKAVVFWHSASSGVYASYCNDGVLPETMTIMNLYSTASGYPAYESFDYYVVTGDSADWLASIGIPALTVELTTHEGTEWSKNLAGVNALIQHYSVAR